jgi:Zn-finger nucleic acid-binding protein
MVRYRVGNGLSLQIDRSPKTGGVWLDPGEWEALKSKGLHEQLHLIFSASYQWRVRTELARAQLQSRFRQRIGHQEFERVREFKSWLGENPRRRDIIAYLLDDETE